MKTSGSSKTFRSRKGGVLLISIMFSTISLIVVGSFIKLANHEMRLSNIQFYSNESINLAEAGLEEALHALNFRSWSSAGWDRSDNRARLSVRDLAIGRAAKGEFHVLVENLDGHPLVTAEGRVQSASGLSSTKQIQITLRERSYFANGITARDRIIFSGGNAHVDSYNFRLDGPYDGGRKRDNGSVASSSVGTDAISVGNGHIWGYVFTGGADPNVRQGSIRGADTPADLLIDPDRIATDFTAEFPAAKPPPSADEENQIERISGGTVLGDPNTPEGEFTVIEVGSIKVGGSDAITIAGPVILVIHGNADITGTGGLNVTQNGNLRIYAYSDFSVSGGGMGNETRDPSKFVIFGMNDHHQEFNLGGNASWEAAVYAPNASLDLNGGGSSGHMSGAVVGKDVKLNGGSKFHYDESLSDFKDAFGYAMDDWAELSVEDRIVFY